MLVNQCSAFPSETEHVGESVGGLVVGKGERGDGESVVCAGEEVEGKVKEVEEGR